MAAIWNANLVGLKNTDRLREVLSGGNFWGLAKDLCQISEPIAEAITFIEGYNY